MRSLNLSKLYEKPAKTGIGNENKKNCTVPSCKTAICHHSETGFLRFIVRPVAIRILFVCISRVCFFFNFFSFYVFFFLFLFLYLFFFLVLGGEGNSSGTVVFIRAAAARK